MKGRWVVLFFLLTVVLLSGCAAAIYPKGATEDYKLGYQEGFKTGYGSGQGISAGMFAGLMDMPFGGSLFVISKLPDKERKKIEGESLEFQRGFANGWRQGVELDADTYSVMFDIIFSEDD